MNLTATHFEAYLSRINFTEREKEGLELLSALQKAHLLTVPFENLDIHSGTEIRLNLNEIYTKVVENKRGGFCFELNGLFFELLKYLGFEAQLISGRVNDKKGGFGQEFDHIAVLVTVDGKQYIADVGFGEFTFSPIPLILNSVHTDERGDYCITKHDEVYQVISKKEKNGKLTPEYLFTTVPRNFQDFKGMCIYHQTDPNSHFTQNKLITLPFDGGRITLTGNKYIRTENGRTKVETLEGVEDFEKRLKAYFDIEANQLERKQESQF